MKLPSSLLALILLSTTPAGFAAGQPGTFPPLLQFVQGPSMAAGLGELKDESLPKGQQEIRIWLGFGIMRVDRMLRLRTGRSGVVRGEVLIHYKNDLSDLSPKDAAEFRRDVRVTCNNFRDDERFATCTANYTNPQNWRSVCRQLISLGILSLPDESSLPPSEFREMDGAAMVVEIRDGSRYRAYEYSNPWARKGAQAEAAAKIMQVVGKAMGAADGT